ncbi:MAG TPA: hypothetical protein VLO11_02655 [Luteolibacter sp.]|nr:hypothetical protein [Luteolibacter sp.]
MKPGSMALARVQQADGRLKVRPVVVLQEMPPYRDSLVCAASSQLRHESPGFDEIMQADDDDFATSGLKVASLVRLGRKVNTRGCSRFCGLRKVRFC